MQSNENKNMIEVVYKYEKLLAILESIVKQEFIATKQDNWVQFANNAISYYAEYWQYIEVALKTNGFWQQIMTK